MSQKKIVITGGGTGGHVFPGIAIGKAFLSRGLEVAYVGSASGMEAKLVPPTGIPFFTVRTGAVKNQSLLTVVRTLLRLVSATLWSLRFLGKQRPDAVIGVGGYVSVPLSFAAFLRRVPLYLQEQNTSVGIANRFLGRLCRRIFVGFEQAKRYFPEKKCVVTGNPIRPEFFSRVPAYNPDSKCLLVFGGSQGAKAINDAVVELYPKIMSSFPGYRIIHQTGEKEFSRIQALYAGKTGVEVLPFLNDMASFYGKAAMVLSRSGALTISELIQVGRPAVLVPFPRRGQNDQITNAYFLKENGVAEVVEQGDCFAERLWMTLSYHLSPERLRLMAAGYSKLQRPDPLATIADLVEGDLASRA